MSTTWDTAVALARGLALECAVNETVEVKTMEKRMKPICVKCQRFYRPKQTGCDFIEGMPIDDRKTEPGTATPEWWTPYKLWNGDLWECAGCNSQIMVGVAQIPIAEHYQPGFTTRCGDSIVQVNDC